MKKSVFTILLFCFTLILQAQVNKTVTGCTAGSLSSRLTGFEKSTVTNLTVTGIINARDFLTMRDEMPVLAVINIGSTTISGYSGVGGPLSPDFYTYPANEIPWYSFCDPVTFIGKTTLTEVTLPSSITSIGRRAFSYCSGLSTLSIPSTVTNIETWAFADCGNSLSLTIPAAVATIKFWAFEAFNGSITVNSGNPYFSSENGVLFNKGKSTLIQCPISKTGSYTIPSTVTLIEINAFSRCSLLTGSLMIPSSVSTIGGWAFRECTGLTGPLVIPHSVDSIGDGAFYQCNGLGAIYAFNESPVDISHSSSVFSLINKATCTLYVPNSFESAYQAANQWKDFNNIVEMPSSTSNFPYSENFSPGLSRYSWTHIDHQGNGQIWQIGATTEDISPNLTGDYAFINSNNYGSGNTQNADFVSPVFDFSQCTNIVLGFNHFFRNLTSSSATLSFSVNNGVDWTLIQSWTSSTTNPLAFSQNLTPQVSGYPTVLFKWNYTGTYEWYWAIDDISITADYFAGTTETLTNVTVIADESRCFDATEDITVAGGGPVDFESGSIVDLVAGQTITFLPGFHANSGSNMHAYITLTGDYCNTISPLIAKVTDVEKNALVSDETAKSVFPGKIKKSVKVYPNPNNGQFTLELTNIESGSAVCIYNMLGAKVYQSKAMNGTSQIFNLSEIEKGIYFVKVIDGKEQFTRKMVVN